MNDVEVIIPRKAFLLCYHHLIESYSDIDFLWGGRDSGKSRFIASILIKACLELPYFRCVLVRKVFNTIKESQWQMIRDVATAWGVDHLFSFNINPLEIKCVNGNRFICRGMDDSANLKSISNPSHCWAEEMSQLSLDDFILIMTSLRCNTGKVKMWCSFNPEADVDYEDFWLYKTFYADQIDKNFTSTWSIEVPAFKEVSATKVDYVYTSTHTTYHDNRYCKAERAAFLEQLYFLDPYYYKVFTLGEWGNRKTTDPFFYTFNIEKHVGITKHNSQHETILSFDFNKSPLACGVYQFYGNKVYGIEAINLGHSDIYKMCEYILVNYSGCLFIVTGDATGKNTTALVKDDINFYTVIKEKLNLSTGQLKIPSVNPHIEENRMLCNSVLKGMNCTFDIEKCKPLIFDFTNVSINDLGKIDKGDRSNPKKRADHADHFRYFCNVFCRNALKL